METPKKQPEGWIIGEEDYPPSPPFLGDEVSLSTKSLEGRIPRKTTDEKILFVEGDGERFFFTLKDQVRGNEDRDSGRIAERQEMTAARLRPQGTAGHSLV